MKEQKGITLVALVITVIVLLILSATAITQFLRSNIIAKAQDSQENYGQASLNEENTIKEYEEFINGYGNNGGGSETKNPWENAGLTEGLVVYDAGYMTNSDNPLGWENVSLQVYKNGTLSFAYTYGENTYTGSTTIENCTVTANAIVVNTWTGGNITDSHNFYFIGGGSCIVNDECMLTY